MLAYRGWQGGGGGGRRCVWGLRVKKTYTHREVRRILVGDHHENAVTVRWESFCGKGAEAYSLSGRFPALSPLWFFFSGGRQQINRGRRLWKKGQLRMLLCCRNGSDRPAERWACTGASAPFPSLRKAPCHLFIYLGSVSPHPPSSPSISWCKAGEG